MGYLCWGGRVHLNVKAHVFGHLLDFVGWDSWGGEGAVDEQGFSIG